MIDSISTKQYYYSYFHDSSRSPKNEIVWEMDCNNNNNKRQNNNDNDDENDYDNNNNGERLSTTTTKATTKMTESTLETRILESFSKVCLN